MVFGVKTTTTTSAHCWHIRHDRCYLEGCPAQISRDHSPYFHWKRRRSLTNAPKIRRGAHFREPQTSLRHCGMAKTARRCRSAAFVAAAQAASAGMDADADAADEKRSYVHSKPQRRRFHEPPRAGGGGRRRCCCGDDRCDPFCSPGWR